MQKPVLAKDIMVTRLVTLSPHMDVFEAIGLLLKYQISGAPVLDPQRNLLGVLSEKCCMSALIDATYDQMPGNEVCCFMDRQPRTVEEDTDLLTIVQIFLHESYRRVQVVRDGKLVGQISRRDVLRAAHKLTEIAPDRETALLYLSSLMERNEAPIAQ